jgi:hypothetical protein
MEHDTMRGLIPRQPDDGRAPCLTEAEDPERRRDGHRQLVEVVNRRTQFENARHRHAARLRSAGQLLNLTARERASVDSRTDIGAPW